MPDRKAEYGHRQGGSGGGGVRSSTSVPYQAAPITRPASHAGSAHPR